MNVHIAPATGDVAAVVEEFKRELEALPSAGRFSAADIETLYALAYREYGQARYEDALRYFQYLLIYRPTNGVYQLGAALCLQRLRRYELAITVYTALRFLEPSNPSHLLAVAECHLLCHKLDQARQTLMLVIDFCRQAGSHDQVRARAQAMLQLMGAQHEQPVAA